MLTLKCQLWFRIARPSRVSWGLHKAGNIVGQLSQTYHHKVNFVTRKCHWLANLNSSNASRLPFEDKRSFNGLFRSSPCFIWSGSGVHVARLSSNTLITKPSPELSDVQSDVAKKHNEIAENNTYLSVKQLVQCYFKLSKIRLTGFVVLTSMAGYTLAPGDFVTSTFVLASLGTMLCSCSANTINQWLEVPFDSQMARTKNRVLVRGLISPLHAVSFGALTGLTGLLLLMTQVNGLTAMLGAANIFLYTMVYTPLKRLSIVNTWVGSLVGALPPLMGWSACAGTLDIGAVLLAGILYSWQFPHFNALSWNLRADYSRAGYRMASVTNPELCRKVALRHSISLLALSSLLPVVDVTSWWLAVDSLSLNLPIIWLAWKFNKNSDNKSARTLFRFSLLHLPLLMFLILIHKKPEKHEETIDENLALVSLKLRALNQFF